LSARYGQADAVDSPQSIEGNHNIGEGENGFSH
jgi:hypothetical protein